MRCPRISLVPALALLASLTAAQQAISLPAVRACAEGEPALGALVTYPTGLPNEVLVEIAEDDTLFVLVDSPSQQLLAEADYRGWGIDLAHVEFVPAPTESIWTRDWSAAAGFDASGQHRLVDPIFLCYTVCAYGGPVLTGGLTHAADDVTPAALAAHTGVGYLSFPAHLVGGNIDFDGLGNAFCTEILLDENAHWGVPESTYRRQMNRALGIADLRVLPDFDSFGLQHVDCVLKVLDEETLVITRPPAGHDNHRYVEALARRAASNDTAYGRSYTIHRIDAPAYSGDPLTGPTANYANTLILNGKILVPQFGLPAADAAALQVYRDAMPGYEVLGYTLVGGPYPLGTFTSQDALHCRTHQVFDPGMLLIKHPRVRAATAADATYPVWALIHAYSQAALLPSELDLFWRVSGAATWNEIPLQPGAGPDEYTAAIPAQLAGTTVEYFLSAADASGRVERKPPLAPQGYYSFLVQ